MKAPQQLRPPDNWQDFETLCHKLWGEIWKYPEIKKNGRSGQEQHGVDIFALPSGASGYWGIQCKGKGIYLDANYRHRQFTAEEIDNEIEKAKKFRPALQKLLFATTAVRDARNLEYVREKNIANIQAGLFEVHLYSWEDIVELIDEHKSVHDWYVHHQGYRQSQSVQVSFPEARPDLAPTVKFRQPITVYRQQIVPAENFPYTNPMEFFLMQMPSPPGRTIGEALISQHKTKENLSYFPVYIHIKNTGYSSVEDYKLIFEIEGPFQQIARTNKTFPLDSPEYYHTQSPTIALPSKDGPGKITPPKPKLVGGEVFIADPFYIKPITGPSEIIITWQLLANEFKDSGKLWVHVKPTIEEVRTELLTKDPLVVRKGYVRGDIEDFIVEI